MQFYVDGDRLNCEVSSRSTDVYTGLPYDIGFFSFVNELVYSKIKKDKYPTLTLGDTTMKTTFTQIYDKSARQALALKNSYQDKIGVFDIMPDIDDPDTVLQDILDNTANSSVIQWINNKAE